ncbi:SUMF1/EgtB/PvdO family nonheme iron enzyme [Paraburkholderia sp. 32]|uniref:SUMF1/EgtB/PvdO family nonheme iron enzyme n=1 Tax=Paraburkholderia sp. 32 TaxID=2991057 RepID=UPI003D25C1A4
MTLATNQFIIFLSGVSKEFHEWRTYLKAHLESRGARVFSQNENPCDVKDAAGIHDRQLVKSHLVICMIGIQEGEVIDEAVMHDMREKGLIPEQAPEKMTWTQWEYFCARRHLKQCTDAGQPVWLMTVFCNMNDPRKDPEVVSRLPEGQRRYVSQLVEEARTSLSPLWSANIHGAEGILDLVASAARDKSGGLFEPFQAALWRRLQTDYRAAVRTKWLDDYGEDMPFEDTGNSTDNFRQFVSDQQMQRLEQPCPHLRKALSPEAFLAGHDTEREIAAHDTGTWHACERQAIIRLLTCESDTGQREQFRPQIPTGDKAWAPRVCIVSAGGVGKTTCTRRLVHELSIERPDEDGLLAIRILAFELRGMQGTSTSDVAAVMSRTMIAVLDHDALKGLVAFEPEGPEGDAQHHLLDFVKGRLEQDLVAGRLVIVIDELDHEPQTNLRFLVAAQRRSDWWRCPIVVACRPHALLSWEQRVSGEQQRVDMLCWCFVELCEFTEPQSRRMLGMVKESDGHAVARYDLLRSNMRGKIHTPRVLAYILKTGFTMEELRKLRTAADVYWRAVKEILKQSIDQIHSADQTSQSDEQSVERQQHLLGILSALGYLSLMGGIDNEGRNRVDWDKLKGMLLDAKREQRGNGKLTGYQASEMQLNDDRRFLGKLSAIVDNGFLESMAVGAHDPKLGSLIRWDNLTIRDFLAAYWLAQHGPLRPKGGPPTLPPHLVYFPDAKKGDERDSAYDLNCFLADMPLGAVYPGSWVAAARAWYEPNLMRLGERRRATEMLFRSWSKMHLFAGYQVDDWWDVPYSLIADNSAADQRIEAIRKLKWDPPHPNCESNPALESACSAARACITSYRDEFSALLSSGSAPVRHFAFEGWKEVPAGSFKMGSHLETQGLPDKTRAYWREVLARVARGGPDDDPYKLAERCTPEEWFSGAVGKRDRADDIASMHKVFADYLAKLNQRGFDTAIAEAEALDEITNMWRTKDETPEKGEDDQPVASFTMNELPVQLSVYQVFAGGQVELIKRNLRGYGAPDDYPVERPVIFVSWYDSWAFCEWANWSEGGVRYQCRLPHEPEWEFACRHGEGGELIPFAQRYWWSDTFYDHERTGEKEPLSKLEAHADGSPGATRDPSVAAPNGLGFRDMLGNVWEWCANHYDPRWLETEVRHGEAAPAYSRYRPASRPPDNAVRSLRGGLWYYVDHLSTCANRYRQVCEDADYKKGFRVVREVVVKTTTANDPTAKA